MKIKSTLILFIIYSTLLSNKIINVDLITTNDLHGAISSQKAYFMNPQFPPTIIGGSAFSKYIDEVRVKINSTKEGILILDGGNFFQGNPLGLTDNGKTMIEWMNRIGYDGMVPGSYDFISGAENLNVLAKLANFPFLFSNLNCNDCPLVSSNIKPYLIREISGVKVGGLGVVNSLLAELVLAENLSGTDSEKEVLSTKKWIPKMKAEGAEIVIVLSSSGVPWDREEEYENFVEKVNNGEVNENSTSLNALEMAYFAEDVDFITPAVSLYK